MCADDDACGKPSIRQLDLALQVQQGKLSVVVTKHRDKKLGELNSQMEKYIADA